MRQKFHLLIQVSALVLAGTLSVAVGDGPGCFFADRSTESAVQGRQERL